MTKVCLIVTEGCRVPACEVALNGLANGPISVYSRNLRTGQTVTATLLPGFNKQPDWLHGGRTPCLLFIDQRILIIHPAGRTDEQCLAG